MVLSAAVVIVGALKVVSLSEVEIGAPEVIVGRAKVKFWEEVGEVV